MKWKQLFIGHFLTLIIGSLIYVAFRSRSLVMFSWFEQCNLDKGVARLRAITGKDENIPDFIIYALPDGLWMFSYMSIILYLWDNHLKKENILWIFGLPVIATISETGQYLRLVSGTFDAIDFLMYMLGIALPLFIYKVEITNFKIKQI
ncbi:hypothetical protein [Flavobacterium amniphilum]|uniref:hypothetical protein n=1 Tax=Flavobacterium amniphilum TaxID=1834035 RepID=UPI00202A2ECA|nr:hypothetical protein [Flavobacterium amniphilum]